MEKTAVIASRGRGIGWIQHYEPRTDSLTNTITNVSKDNLLMIMKFPCILHKQRSEQGRALRRQCPGDIGVPYQAAKALLPRNDGICPTIMTFQTDTEIMIKQDMNTTLTYHPNPAKEDLLEYFSRRIRVRKMTPKEALRLMDFSEESINKIMNAEIKTTLKNGAVKTRKMPKTQLYKQAGNSIVCSCIYHLGRTLWIHAQPENIDLQPSLFDL